MMPQPRRKKWTETEEMTLIDKYGEMSCDGTLSKMKTREKKYKPVALHVSSIHHARDPVSYTWQWSWKDVSTKVQNMRHQYALVKQKINGVFIGVFILKFLSKMHIYIGVNREEDGRKMVQYFVITLSSYEHETWFIKLHGMSSSIF